jgi:SAM-dependent methyltransferase
MVEFYNDHVAVWDSAGLAAGRLTTVNVSQELSWLWKYYTPKGLNGPVKTLVAGCGSGVEVYQYATYYKDAEITAIDLSANNLAFAIRQHKDLGIDNIKFFQADINELEPTTFPEQFDMVIANGVIHHLKDPLRGWQRLSSLLRSGGIMRMSLYSGKYVELLQKTREFLNQSQKFQSPLFSKDKPLAQCRRTPTMDEVRNSRTEILACDEKDLEDLKELVTSPQFYALHEFYDLVFHPKVQGFSFEIIGECLKQVGLKLIGFEFPGLSQEYYLKYTVEYPEDVDMVNVKYLEAFNKKFPEAFKNFTHTINFLAEKP